MTRWLYLCNDLGISLDGVKGASEHVRAITRGLCQAGQEVSVLAAQGTLPVGHPARQINTPIGADVRATADALRAWLAGAEANPAMGGEIAQMLYDVQLREMLCSNENRLLRDSDRPGESVNNRFDVVLERLSLFSTAGRAFAQKLGVPYLVEMNAPLAQEAARYRDAGLETLARSIERQTLAAADVVMTVSGALREHAIRDIGLDPQRVVTVPNGVDLRLFAGPRDRGEARRLAGVPDDAVVFGFVGSLKPWHGIDTLLEAFARIQDLPQRIHLLVIGDGRNAPKYRERAKQLGVDRRTTFFGEAEHALVARLMQAMDVGVAPYLPQDNFYFSPLKLYEDMAAGLCTIASGAGQIADVIRHDSNGLLFSPGSCTELARLLASTAEDAALRQRLGAEARRDASACDWSQVAARIISLAEEVFPRSRPPAAAQRAHGRREHEAEFAARTS